MAIKPLDKKNPQGVDPFKTFLVNKHERVGGNVYKRTTFQKMGPPVDTLFLTSPVVCIRRVLTTQRKSGLITLQIV